MRYFSMFSGVGGFEEGIRRAHPTAECVGFSEIDRYAIKIYESHFKEHKNYGDATKIDPDTLPDFDLLTAGFPCQSFSIAGKRLGFEDTRGTLFFDIARILKVKRPRLLLLENVKGLLSHDNGRTFKTILSALVELGYDVEWQVLNSKNHGVPQNRERVFIVGHLGGFGGREVFPIGEAGGEHQDINHQAPEQIGLKRFDNYNKVFSDPKVSGSLKACPRPSGSNDPNLLHIGESVKIRRLTPTECERLQGYPEIEKYSIIRICLDHQKNLASAEILNHRLPSSAESAGKGGFQDRVLSAESFTSTSNQPTNKPVQPDVLINCVENGVEILSQERCLLSAINANKKEWCHRTVKIDDFVQLLVGVNIMLEKTTPHGKAASLQSEVCSIAQENGLRRENWSGSVMMPLADAAETDLITLKELLKSTTLDHLSTGYSEQRLATLFWYVIRVISGYIPKEISDQNTFTIGIRTKVGYTYGVSDSQRYKTLGNSVTVNVIQAIMERLI